MMEGETRSSAKKSNERRRSVRIDFYVKDKKTVVYPSTNSNVKTLMAMRVRKIIME